MILWELFLELKYLSCLLPDLGRFRGNCSGSCIPRFRINCVFKLFPFPPHGIFLKRKGSSFKTSFSLFVHRAGHVPFLVIKSQIMRCEVQSCFLRLLWKNKKWWAGSGDFNCHPLSLALPKILSITGQSKSVSFSVSPLFWSPYWHPEDGTCCLCYLGITVSNTGTSEAPTISKWRVPVLTSHTCEHTHLCKPQSFYKSEKAESLALLPS